MAAQARYGGLVSFDKRTTIVNDISLAREILKSRDGIFQIRENFLQARLTDADIEETLRARMLLNPGLRRTAVEATAPQVARTTREVLRDWDNAGGVDPVPLIEEITSRAVADYYFGGDGQALPKPVGALLDALSVVIGNPLALPPGLHSKARRRIRRRHRELKEIVVPLLCLRESGSEARDDFAAQVVRSRDPEAGQSLERIADLLIGAMLAAHRVPAAAGAWLLMLVADHPHVLDRLVEEAHRFAAPRRLASCPCPTLLGVGDETCSGGSDSPRYPFATACVYETLRLYPATWLLARVAAREVVLGDYAFGAGHHFLISPYVLHRDEASFEAADSFRPDRWRGRAPSSTGGFMAFGHGQHACPGASFAVTVLVTMLLTVVDGWQVNRLPTTVRPNPRTTLLPDGLRLAFISRASAGPEVLPGVAQRQGQAVAI
ncbi:MAG: Cytochrome family protein [Nocardioides sp.]|nr:Cytochrome family protein [Nocardioides sp.]